MTPSEIRLFTPKEQTLLVDTEPARLRELSEDELGDLLGRVRRLRNKYSDLHRSQGRASVEAAAKRYAATTSNQRTLRKAEVAEDAVARVARHLATAARAGAKELKAARIEAARSGSGAPKRSKSAKDDPAPSKRTRSRSKVKGSQVGSTSARNKRNQAARDNKRS